MAIKMLTYEQLATAAANSCALVLGTMEHGPKVLPRNAKKRFVLEGVEVHSWMLALPS
jgi:hypothetical protein